MFYTLYPEDEFGFEVNEPSSVREFVISLQKDHELFKEYTRARLGLWDERSLRPLNWAYSSLKYMAAFSCSMQHYHETDMRSCQDEIYYGYFKDHTPST